MFLGTGCPVAMKESSMDVAPKYENMTYVTC